MSTLKIVAHRAANLKAGDINGKSDPYVKVYWQGESENSGAKTSVQPATLYPEWNETIAVPWKMPERRVLVVEVWDQDRGRSDDFLGQVTVDVNLMTSSETPYPLKPRSASDTGIKGSVYLSFVLPPEYREAESGVMGLLHMIQTGGGAGLNLLLMAQVTWVDNRIRRVPALNLLVEKSGVPREKVVLGLFLFFFLFVTFGFGAQALANLLGTVYPLYASFKAVKSDRKDDDSQWLTYWIVFGFFTVVESFTDKVLFWMPFYYAGKVFFLVWCMHPSTMGASQLYSKMIEPTLTRYETRVDRGLDRLTQSKKMQ